MSADLTPPEDVLEKALEGFDEDGWLDARYALNHTAPVIARWARQQALQDVRTELARAATTGASWDGDMHSSDALAAISRLLDETKEES